MFVRFYVTHGVLFSWIKTVANERDIITPILSRGHEMWCCRPLIIWSWLRIFSGGFSVCRQYAGSGHESRFLTGWSGNIIVVTYRLGELCLAAVALSAVSKLYRRRFCWTKWWVVFCINLVQLVFVGSLARKCAIVISDRVQITWVKCQSYFCIFVLITYLIYG